MRLVPFGLVAARAISLGALIVRRVSKSSHGIRFPQRVVARKNSLLCRNARFSWSHLLWRAPRGIDRLGTDFSVESATGECPHLLRPLHREAVLANQHGGALSNAK